MPKHGFTTVTLPDALVDELRRQAPYLGLAVLRPDDGRSKGTLTIVIRGLLEHYRKCPQSAYVPPLELHEVAP